MFHYLLKIITIAIIAVIIMVIIITVIFAIYNNIINIIDYYHCWCFIVLSINDYLHDHNQFYE